MLTKLAPTEKPLFFPNGALKKHLISHNQLAKKLGAYLLTDEPSWDAFISEKRFLIRTSSLAQEAAALTSSSDRPLKNKLIYKK